MTDHLPRYMLFLALMLFWGHVAGQRGHISPGLSKGFVSGNSFGINLKLLHLNSRIQPKDQLTAGCPVSRLRATYSGLDFLAGFSGVRMQHFLTTSLAIPARLSSGDLRNGVPAIDGQRSVLTRQQQMYHFNLPLLTTWNAQFWYGATAILQFDNRSIYNQWDDFEEKWDISAGFGPNFAADLYYSGRFSLRCETHLPVVLPNASVARLKAGSVNEMVHHGQYQSLRLIPSFELVGKGTIFKGIAAMAGYRYTMQLGYATPGLPVSLRTTLTESTDGIHELFFGLRYQHHGKWLMRRFTPGCRSTE